MMKKLLTIVCAVGLLLACGERADRVLVGQWQAVQVLEEGDSLKLDPKEVSFEFRPNNRYSFSSTLRYSEAGKWRYENGHLFATDTTSTAEQERVVAVETVNADSLVLRMMAQGKEQRLTLLRQ